MTVPELPDAPLVAAKKTVVDEPGNVRLEGDAVTPAGRPEIDTEIVPALFPPTPEISTMVDELEPAGTVREVGCTAIANVGASTRKLN